MLTWQQNLQSLWREKKEHWEKTRTVAFNQQFPAKQEMEGDWIYRYKAWLMRYWRHLNWLVTENRWEWQTYWGKTLWRWQDERWHRQPRGETKLIAEPKSWWLLSFEFNEVKHNIVASQWNCAGCQGFWVLLWQLCVYCICYDGCECGNRLLCLMSCLGLDWHLCLAVNWHHELSCSQCV